MTSLKGGSKKGDGPAIVTFKLMCEFIKGNDELELEKEKYIIKNVNRINTLDYPPFKNKVSDIRATEYKKTDKPNTDTFKVSFNYTGFKKTVRGSVHDIVTILNLNVNSIYNPDRIYRIQLILDDDDITYKSISSNGGKLKRCKNGSRRNKKTKECKKNTGKSKLGRCPNGTRRNKKTKLCEGK